MGVPFRQTAGTSDKRNGPFYKNKLAIFYAFSHFFPIFDLEWSDQCGGGQKTEQKMDKKSFLIGSEMHRGEPTENLKSRESCESPESCKSCESRGAWTAAKKVDK